MPERSLNQSSWFADLENPQARLKIAKRDMNASEVLHRPHLWEKIERTIWYLLSNVMDSVDAISSRIVTGIEEAEKTKKDM